MESSKIFYERYLDLPDELQQIIQDRIYELKHTEKMKRIRTELPIKAYKLNLSFLNNLTSTDERRSIFTNDHSLFLEECFRIFLLLDKCNCFTIHRRRNSNSRNLIKKKYRLLFFSRTREPCPRHHLQRLLF